MIKGREIAVVDGVGISIVGGHPEILHALDRGHGQAVVGCRRRGDIVVVVQNADQSSYGKDGAWNAKLQAAWIVRNNDNDGRSVPIAGQLRTEPSSPLRFSRRSGS